MLDKGAEPPVVARQALISIINFLSYRQIIILEDKLLMNALAVKPMHLRTFLIFTVCSLTFLYCKLEGKRSIIPDD